MFFQEFLRQAPVIRRAVEYENGSNKCTYEDSVLFACAPVSQKLETDAIMPFILSLFLMLIAVEYSWQKMEMGEYTINRVYYFTILLMGKTLLSLFVAYSSFDHENLPNIHCNPTVCLGLLTISLFQIIQADVLCWFTIRAWIADLFKSIKNTN